MTTGVIGFRNSPSLVATFAQEKQAGCNYQSWQQSQNSNLGLWAHNESVPKGETDVYAKHIVCHE